MPVEDTLTPPCQEYVHPNFMKYQFLFQEDKTLRYMLSLKTGWILAFILWTASEMQVDAVNTCPQQ